MEQNSRHSPKGEKAHIFLCCRNCQRLGQMTQKRIKKGKEESWGRKDKTLQGRAGDSAGTGGAGGGQQWSWPGRWANVPCSWHCQPLWCVGHQLDTSNASRAVSRAKEGGSSTRQQASVRFPGHLKAPFSVLHQD